MSTYLLEIRAAEGGAHAKRLIHQQADIYRAYALKNNLKCSTLEDHLEGIVVLRVSGDGASRLLRESGGHRHQGRSGQKIHTSTVTVAVIPETIAQQQFNPNDVTVIRTKDSGKGGQHRNKTESCVIVTHTPTGLQAKAAERKQGQNLQHAMIALRERVERYHQEDWHERLNSERQKLIGSGQRGDKIRTYREQDNIVIDHATNQKQSLTHILQGYLF